MFNYDEICIISWKNVSKSNKDHFIKKNHTKQIYHLSKLIYSLKKSLL